MSTLLLLSVAALWTLAATAWPDLPEHIPTHFDLSGRPDAWAAPGFASWFLLPTLATGMVFLLGLGLPRWLVGLVTLGLVATACSVEPLEDPGLGEQNGFTDESGR